MGMLGMVLRPKRFLVRVELSARTLISFVLTSTRSTISYPIIVVSVAMNSLSSIVTFARFSISMT